MNIIMSDLVETSTPVNMVHIKALDYKDALITSFNSALSATYVISIPCHMPNHKFLFCAGKYKNNLSWPK